VLASDRRCCQSHSLFNPAPRETGLKVVDDTQPSRAQTTTGPLRRHISGKINMAYLAGLLSNRPDRPVVDTTNIRGIYDVDLEWSPDAGRYLRIDHIDRVLAEN
jgi:uncharacterized protein (TIGR03435 family)